MLNKANFSTSETVDYWRKKLLGFAQGFEVFMLLDNGGYANEYSSGNELVLAVGAENEYFADKTDAFAGLKTFHLTHKSELYGYLGYDLKNQLEKLSSENLDNLGFPDMYFFKPLHVITFGNGVLSIDAARFSAPELIYKQIIALPKTDWSHSVKPKIKQRISEQAYIANVELLKKHIKYGNIYEANFCMEFYAEKADISPIRAFLNMVAVNPVPFGVLFKLKNKYAISASPERFLKKQGNKVISQPIKGTAKRSRKHETDSRLAKNLASNAKERAENIMITDLARNDLSRIASRGSVTVAELCKVYTYPLVHQMISTITASVKPGIHFTEVLRNTFPAGSMTGAPKISAMQLIDECESTKRGLYAGSLGYITANGDFDFSVVIRTILYDLASGYLSYMAGSAITDRCTPQAEYEECLLKAKAMHSMLSAER